MTSCAPSEEGRGDGLLVAAARRGDRGALAALLVRHRPALLAVCRRALRDPELAEDAAQEAALQAIVRLGELREPERFGPWLRRIGLNTCRYWTRQGSRSRWSWEALRAGGLIDEPDGGGDPARLADRLDEAATVRRALAGLPEGQRAAVALCYLAGLPLAQAAALLGTQVGAVKARLHKARRALRAWLAPVAPGRPTPPRRRGRLVAGGPSDAPRPAAWWWGSPGVRHFRLEVDAAELAEAIVAHLRSAEADRRGIVELCVAVPEAAAVLDAMLLDGVAERDHVGAYVRAVFGASAVSEPPLPRRAAPRRPRFFRLEVDAEALADELHAFVTDPRASRYARPVVAEVEDVSPEMLYVLETMIVEGVVDRRHVAAYVHAAVGAMLR
ncbi:MAG TPA: RNA polymerase sigma factor [Chloroflexota bacterium]|nr:RNA polymerase sigma factor [Chloroflexota bacterium]